MSDAEKNLNSDADSGLWSHARTCEERADYREIISAARNDLIWQWGNSGTEAVKS